MEKKILIADDSKLIVIMVKSVLTKEDDEYVVITAPDGDEAVRKAIEHLPDVILMDWQMPGLSGLEAMAQLRQNEKTKNIPVIMLTGSDSINEAFESGANDFIQKPFFKPELISRIHSSLVAVNLQKELRQKDIENKTHYDKLKMQMEIMINLKKDQNSISSLAEKVQKASLPSDALVKSVLKQHFILNLTKDNILNNFYWVTREGDISYFSVAYFNKQGVSAAFITLFGLASLNEIMSQSAITGLLQPSEILEKLKEKFEQSNYLDNKDKSCFNIVLCALDTNTHNLQYAGVNIPIYVVENKKLVELKTDICNFGLFNEKGAFINHNIQIVPDGLIYLIIDGFNDYNSQLNKTNYLSEKVAKTFSAISEMPFGNQKQMLQKAFENLKKELRLVENILVLGIKDSSGIII
jgi:CheY-like chemotaxis protein